ncbi:NERD domain-containing protein [Microtetraspora sp. AC03309]|uniref:nuclease-related domain-containing protein n=1 Tax=Microtetraspora sp. AC03309 TaxID=2779376 RepID=UPI001E300C40|nr:nuclease-related domain-containing protein [Microtetraspora sp. AC03309]MCC5579221.1 NERD domain-containing protein [Microtetraspora sp. AC03309]
MPSGSIYVPRDEKFTGASPQNLYVTFWFAGRKSRLWTRGVIGVAGFAAGSLLAARFGWADTLLVGLVVGALAALADFLVAWRSYARTAVWRGQKRGEVRTGRLLRHGLTRHGYHVMDGRAVPGEASIDHLVIGPGGVWIVDNEAWAPDTHIARYGERLFFDEKYGTSVAKGLIGAASALAGLLSRETGIDVTISPVLAVHSGKVEGRGGTLVGEGLTVAYPHKVARWMRASPNGSLTAEQVELLSRTAARVLRGGGLRF